MAKQRKTDAEKIHEQAVRQGMSRSEQIRELQKVDPGEAEEMMKDFERRSDEQEPSARMFAPEGEVAVQNQPLPDDVTVRESDLSQDEGLSSETSVELLRQIRDELRQLPRAIRDELVDT